MTNTIFFTRAFRLHNKFFQLSFRNKQADKSFFDTITKSAELHYIAHNHNWDDGTEILTWIVNSSLCDKATAKLIFWRSQPDYYTKFANKEEAETWAQDVYLLLRNIIENFENGYYKTEKLYYNTRDDHGAPSNINYKDPDEKWPIPKYMKTPVNGNPVVVIGGVLVTIYSNIKTIIGFAVRRG